MNVASGIWNSACQIADIGILVLYCSAHPEESLRFRTASASPCHKQNDAVKGGSTSNCGQCRNCRCFLRWLFLSHDNDCIHRAAGEDLDLPTREPPPLRVHGVVIGRFGVRSDGDRTRPKSFSNCNWGSAYRVPQAGFDVGVFGSRAESFGSVGVSSLRQH